ncbi:MAG: cobalamin-dependent protein, partial [Planctomycetes bacterium]|nr:cobalamin-dependent protein [Planctomycetota bacterium]
DTMPLQLGLISAYCLKEHGDQVEIEIFKYTADFEKAALAKAPFLIGVSNYLWNIDLSRKYVRRLKQRYPEVISVFGGPNYPDVDDEQTEWLQACPEADFYIYKDGEVPFARLVGRLLEGADVATIKQERLPSVHALAEGVMLRGETEPRLRDLTVIPSPYTTGLMDAFFDQRLIPTIQTNRGCPFTCTFCTEGGSYYNKVFRSSHERKVAEVDYIVQRIKHTKTLRITDSNFGMFPEDQDFCAHLSKMQDDVGYPEYVMCSTGKNRKEQVLKCNELLHGAMRLTASVQSLSPEVLAAVKRNNISLENLMFLSDETSETDTHAYSEVILGLPGDSVTAMSESFQGLMDAGIGNITQHQLALIHGTELNSRETREKYSLEGQFRPIQRCVGKYRFGDEEFASAEIEEICVSSNTLSYDDYVDMRRLYLTVGMFYNDRIFGEIHALLRILGLSTYGWLASIHRDIERLPVGVQSLYEGFTRDTLAELWESADQLMTDVCADVDRFESGECGGNIIYKYRSKSIVEHFEELLDTAYAYLRRYLKDQGVDREDAVADIERFARLQKLDLLNVDFKAEEDFSFDLIRLIFDPTFVRGGGTLDQLRRPTRIRFQHTEKQRRTIEREISFYGTDIPGLTMMISRYPVKRFYRRVQTVSDRQPSLVTQEVG